MSLLRRLLSGLCFALACSQFSHAQVTADDDTAQNWGVGDTYTIEVTRGGVTEQFTGELVHADETWVSIKSTLPARMIGVPSKPGSRIFKLVARKNVGIGRETHVEIVPTDDVQIISHQPGTGKGSDEQLPQLPKVGDAVAIRYVVRGELVKARGELTRISADQFAVTEKNFVGKTRSIPVLGELPFVGGMFTHTVFSMQTNDLAIPIADVLSIQVPSSVGLDRHNGGNAPE